MPIVKEVRISFPPRGKYSAVDMDESEQEDVGNVELTAAVKYTGISSRDSSPASKEEIPSSIIYDRTVMACVALYGLLAFGDVVGNETLPLLCKLDSSEGGLSMTTSEIGFALSAGGVCGLGFSLFMLPSIIGAGRRKLAVFRSYSLANMFLVLSFPLLGKALQHYTLQSIAEGEVDEKDSRWHHMVAVGLLVCAHISRGVAATVTFTVMIIFVNHSVTDEHLGRVNGLGQMAAAAARSVGPALGGVLWSQSLRVHFVFSNFLLVSVIMLGCCVLSFRLPESIEDKRKEKIQCTYASGASG